MRLYLRATALLCALTVAGGAGADLATYLRVINYDDVLADPRFSGLSGAGQTIAILDTGIDPRHTAFDGIAGSRADDGVNEATDTPAPPQPVWGDANGHGTAVASVAAGRPVMLTNGQDMRGIAPGAGLFSGRVLSATGTGGFGGIVDALDALILDVLDPMTSNTRLPGADLRVVNLSLGTTTTFVTEPTGALVDAFRQRVHLLEDLGVAVVGASGNSADPGGISFPAILAEVVAVGATDLDGNLASFGNRSPQLDLVAPGVDIIGAQRPAGGSFNLYNTALAGTSFSAPIVSGSLVLINELYLDRTGRYPTVAEALNFLQMTGTVIPNTGAAPGQPESFVQLDLYAALVAVDAVPEPTAGLLLAIGLGGVLLRRAA